MTTFFILTIHSVCRKLQYFHFGLQNKLFMIFKMAGCILKIPTLLLNPILTYMHLPMLNGLCVINVINDGKIVTCLALWHIFYVNMGVKWSVRTSGLQPAILNILKYHHLGRGLNISFFILCWNLFSLLSAFALLFIFRVDKGRFYQ